jgi:hypothetical protein
MIGKAFDVMMEVQPLFLLFINVLLSSLATSALQING